MQEVQADKEGRVRKAIVQTPNGLLRRAVSSLAVLDVADNGKTDPEESGDQCYGEENVRK